MIPTKLSVSIVGICHYYALSSENCKLRTTYTGYLAVSCNYLIVFPVWELFQQVQLYLHDRKDSGGQWEASSHRISGCFIHTNFSSGKGRVMIGPDHGPMRPCMLRGMVLWSPAGISCSLPRMWERGTTYTTGIEPTQARSGRAGYACPNLSAMAGIQTHTCRYMQIHADTYISYLDILGVYCLVIHAHKRSYWQYTSRYIPIHAYTHFIRTQTHV